MNPTTSTNQTPNNLINTSSEKVDNSQVESYKNFKKYLDSYIKVFISTDNNLIEEEILKTQGSYKKNTKINIWYASYWDLLKSNIQTPAIDNNEGARISVEITKRFSISTIVNKIYLNDLPNYVNVDVLISKSSYTNKELESLIKVELEIRNLYNNLSINFNYLSTNNTNIRKDAILIYENNG